MGTSNIVAVDAWIHARTMASRGFRVFPLLPGRKEPDRRLAPHGFYNATTDLAVIDGWTAASPNANYGVATGDGLFVLDSDNQAGQDELDRRGLRTGMVVATRHGYHNYLLTDVEVRNGTKLFGAEALVDVRGDGGYVVGPGSVHPEGGVYELITDGEPWRATDWEVCLAQRVQQPIPGGDVMRPSELSGIPMPEAVRCLLDDTSDGKNTRIYQAVLRLVPLRWSDSQISDAVLSCPALRSRVRSGKVRNPHGYVAQKIESARRWLAARPDAEPVNVDRWVSDLRSMRFSGSVLRVLHYVADVARTSPTFPLSARDIAAEIGCPKTTAHRALQAAAKAFVIQKVYQPEQGSLRRCVYRLVNISPDSGTQDVVLTHGTQTTTLSVPEIGKHDIWGHAKLQGTYPVLNALSDREYRSAKEVAAIIGRSASTAYGHLHRLEDAGLISHTSDGYIRLGSPELRGAADVLAERLGMTGWVDHVKRAIADERAQRRDDRYEWWLRTRKNRRASGALSLVPDVRSRSERTSAVTVQDIRAA